MGDDADQLAFLVQSSQCRKRRFEGLVVEGSEPFIEEERVDTHIAARHLGEAERQGQADDEAFAAREILRGTDLTRLVVVDDVEFQRLRRVADEQVAVRHLPELAIGMHRHHLEGQPLGEVPEFLAVGGANQQMQIVPAGAFLFPGIQAPDMILLFFLQLHAIIAALLYPGPRGQGG